MIGWGGDMIVRICGIRVVFVVLFYAKNGANFGFAREIKSVLRHQDERGRLVTITSQVEICFHSHL